MDGKCTTKAIIYSFFKYSKDYDGKEKGMICVNYLTPNSADEFGGWKNYSSWLPFTDELFKYLKSTLIKQSDLELTFREDYRNANLFIRDITKINDFVIKQ